MLIRWGLLVLIVTTILLFVQTTSVGQIQEEQTIQMSGIHIEERVYKEVSQKEERITDIADKYNAEPEYLIYIVELEKEFNLKPYSLLSVIAAESGFKPQTKMDVGSLSYNTTQMKMHSAKTAYMAMTKYFDLDVEYPTDELLRNDKYYATYLAAGYLKYLNAIYKDDDYYETYTAYNWGIPGRMIYYNRHGNFKSPYAMKVEELQKSFEEYIEGEGGN